MLNWKTFTETRGITGSVLGFLIAVISDGDCVINLIIFCLFVFFLFFYSNQIKQICTTCAFGFTKNTPPGLLSYRLAKTVKTCHGNSICDYA